jgi:hypothetical protein
LALTSSSNGGGLSAGKSLGSIFLFLALMAAPLGFLPMIGSLRSFDKKVDEIQPLNEQETFLSL